MKIRDLEWWIVGLLGVASFVLAIIGFNLLFTQAGVDRNLVDLAYQSTKVFGMEFVDEFQSPLPWQLEVSRWLSPAVVLYAAGKAVLYFIRREFKSLMVKYYRDHIIVTSLNVRSRHLIADLIKEGRKVVVVAGIEEKQKLDTLEKDGAIIVEGDISSHRFLKNIAAHKARYFVFADDSDEENISSALEVYSYLEKKGRNKHQVLFTHVADDLKLNELKELNFFEEYTERNMQQANCEIRIFSSYERASRMLFNKYAPDVFSPVDSTNDAPIHVAIVGSGKLAQSMIIRLARLGHFANLKKMKITLFHDDQRLITRLNRNLKNLGNLIAIEPIEEDLDLFDADKFNASHHKEPFSAVYLLCEDDEASSGVLNRIARVESDMPLDVVLTLTDPDGILSKWYTAAGVNQLNLHKFNLTEESFTQEALISEKMDDLAKIIHQDYYDGLKEKNPAKASHQPWELLPVDFKNQNREQADHLFVKLRALGGKASAIEKIKNIDHDSLELLSEMEHNRWWAHMALSGWRLAEKRDDKRKFHTDLKPYDELSDEVKQYDRNTILNIPKLIEKYEQKS
jgi:hypothetical protein